MTVPATDRRAGPFPGTGSITALPFTFKVFEAADLVVTKTSTAGVETTLALTTDYTVSVNGDQDSSPGGSVTPVVAPALGESITLTSGLSYEQTLDLLTGGNFSPRAIEDAFDRVVIQIQQLAEEKDRTLRAPISFAGDAVLPAPAAGNVLGWDDTATGLRNIDPATLASIVAYANRRTLVANGAAASYTLAADPGNVSNTLVAVSGVVQTPGVDYTVSGVTLTPTTPWAAGTGNVVIVYGEALPVGTQDASSVTYTSSQSGSTQRTLQAKLSEFVQVQDFAGADPTGVADSTTAIGNALAAAAALNVPLLVNGRFRYTSQIVVPARVKMKGSGITSDEATSGRSRSCFIKDFNGTGFLFSGDDAGVDGVQFDSAAARTGDNVQVTGSRFCAPLIAVTNAGQDGLRIGQTGSTGTGLSLGNANLFYIGRIAALNCGRYGVNIDDTNTGGSGSYPLGVPDCNGGFIGHAECERNNVDGIRFGNCLDNTVSYLVAQTNAGYGVRMSAYARNNVILKSYTESNTTGEGIIEANATQNVVFASSRAVTLGNGWTNSGGNSNLLLIHASGIGQDGNFNSSPWLWGAEFYARTTGAAAYIGGYVDANDLPAWMKIEKDSTSGTKMTFATRTTGVGVEDKVQIDNAGRVFLLKPTQGVYFGTTTASPAIFSGAGTPEAAVTAPVGSLFLRTDGGAGTSLYVKQTGTGNTGWVGK